MRGADREAEALRARIREAALAAQKKDTVTQVAQIEAQDGVSETRELIGMEVIMAGMGSSTVKSRKTHQEYFQPGH